MKTDLMLYGNAGKGFENAIIVKLSSINAKPSREIWVAHCKNETDIRKAAENKFVDIILGLENIEKKDSLHKRESGLNEVICKLAKKNKIAIGFPFNSILHSDIKSQLFGRMMQNVELCKKYGVRMVLASFAETKWDVRSYHELFSFGLVLGMTPKEAKDALEVASQILKEKKEERLPPGVRLVRSN